MHGYLGSPLYMSPEQVRGEGISNQSDIFCIGVVMYELLAADIRLRRRRYRRSRTRSRTNHIPLSAASGVTGSQIIDRALKNIQPAATPPA